MNIYDQLYNQLDSKALQKWQPQLSKDIAAALHIGRNKNLTHWLETISDLSRLPKHPVRLADDLLSWGNPQSLSKDQQTLLKQQLLTFKPWRKGPFSVHGIHIDTEWRSDFKWNRLKHHIAPLTDRIVLDVGCGNGYHCFRMSLQRAKLVIGVDPVLVSVMQFLALWTLGCPTNTFVLPLRMEDIPSQLPAFDTVFSMGLLYHRKSPMEHLLDLKNKLRPGGELVLETLVIEGRQGEVFVPPGRYAKMNNVWFIPTPQTLEIWLLKCGYKNFRTVNVTQTEITEQRSTPWMWEESLPNFLDPHDKNKTIEGHPAPIRAVLIAEKPC